MSSALTNNVIRSGILLSLFALICTALVAFTFQTTRDDIAKSEKQAILRALNDIVDKNSYDNDLYLDTIKLTNKRYLGSRKPVTVYRARQHDKPVAAILTVYATQGYSGAIKLLVGIFANGKLAGVRIVNHRETPGLGDAIDQRKSDWLMGFNGKSLNNPQPKQWLVKKDGGVFDQFTGATISPRAVVSAVKLTLEYYQKHENQIFEKPANIDPPAEP